MMTRSFKDWWDTIPYDLKEKALNGDNKSNTILLNQVNYALLHLELEGKHEAKPSHGELRTWLHSGQVDVVRVK
jgi:hypothetical protein